MTLQWTNDLSVNIGNIDRQHQEIFSRYDDFLDACRNGKKNKVLLELLDFLTSYVDEHFEHEETFMRVYKYPDMDAHIREHQELVQTVQKFRTRLTLQGSSVSLIAELNRALIDWLLGHIKQTDMAFARFLNHDQGMTQNHL